MEAWKLAATLVGSFAAGYLGSMLGLVLGTLRLPLIVLVTGSPLAAAGTNIAISAASAGAGAAGLRAGRVDWSVVAWMAPPSVLGAVLGALAADDVSERVLQAAIAAVLAWSGVDLVLRPVRARARERPRLWPAAISGLGIGALGGAWASSSARCGCRRSCAASASTSGAQPGRTRRRLPARRGRLRDPRRLGRRRHGDPRRRPHRRDPRRLARRPGSGRFDEETLRLALGVVLLLVGLAFALQAAR